MFANVINFFVLRFFFFFVQKIIISTSKVTTHVNPTTVTKLSVWWKKKCSQNYFDLKKRDFSMEKTSWQFFFQKMEQFYVEITRRCLYFNRKKSF